MIGIGRWSGFVSLFVLAVVSLPGWLRAMEIQKYDQMAIADQKEYVIELVEGAQKVLREQGHADLAEKVAKLFTTNDPEGNISIGMTEFDIALAKARVADLGRIKKDPNVTRIEVEHAMIVVLKKNGIDLPKSYMAVMKDFKPKHPPQNQ
jgi:hypothetical protein